jgi:hypothetical protein
VRADGGGDNKHDISARISHRIREIEQLMEPYMSGKVETACCFTFALRYGFSFSISLNLQLILAQKYS